MPSDAETGQANLIRNERLKLTATFLNNVAITVIGASLVGPFFVVLYGFGTIEAARVREFALSAPAWFLIGVGIHLVGRAILGGLKE